MTNEEGWIDDEAWARAERPLLAVDPILERFAAERSLTVARNGREWPERSLRWGDSPNCLIQLYLADRLEISWTLWCCCYEDRPDGRFWKRETIVGRQPIAAFAGRLPRLLEQAYGRLLLWRKQPEMLERAAPSD